MYGAAIKAQCYNTHPPPPTIHRVHSTNSHQFLKKMVVVVVFTYGNVQDWIILYHSNNIAIITLELDLTYFSYFYMISTILLEFLRCYKKLKSTNNAIISTTCQSKFFLSGIPHGSVNWKLIFRCTGVMFQHNTHLWCHNNKMMHPVHLVIFVITDHITVLWSPVSSLNKKINLTQLWGIRT